MENCSDTLQADAVAGQFTNRSRKVARQVLALFESPSRQNRLPAMEGVRGLAVLLVFFVHYYWLFEFLLDKSSTRFGVAYSLATIGHAGVDIFFVLSGYLIYAAALKPNLSYTIFIKRRIERIYPTFLVVLATYIVGSYMAPERSRIPEGLIPATVYIFQNIAMLPGLFAITPMITVAWSLSYEFAYYLFTPFLTSFTGMGGWQSYRRKALIGVMAGSYITASALGWLSHPRIVVFACGMMLYEFTRTRATRVSAPKVRRSQLWFFLFRWL